MKKDKTMKTIPLHTRSHARAYLANLPASDPVALPCTGELTSAAADAVGVLAGEHPSQFARAHRRWHWTAGELLAAIAKAGAAK